MNTGLHVCFYFLTGGKLLYNFVLVSAIQQCKLAIFIHKSSPFWASLSSTFSPLKVITGCQAGLPVLYSNFSLTIYFTHGSVYMSILLSPFIPLFSSLTVSTSPLYISASLFLPCKKIHKYHFSRFYIHALIYYICFSLSVLFHFV